MVSVFRGAGLRCHGFEKIIQVLPSRFMVLVLKVSRLRAHRCTPTNVRVSVWPIHRHPKSKQIWGT